VLLKTTVRNILFYFEFETVSSPLTVTFFMKLLLVTLSLTLVGSCATPIDKATIDQLKKSIHFDQAETIDCYAKTITADELRYHVYQFSSDDFQGRRAGEAGHHKASKYLQDFYRSQDIASPLGANTYYQIIPNTYFNGNIKTSENVIAYIKGSHIPEEVIIISAHSDHEGYTETEIYNGADDNGSGTAAILEIAQAFKAAEQNGFQPKRSLVFLHFTGEEVGLKGSKFYTQHPVFALKNTVANLNIDMIGRVDKAHQDHPNYMYLIGADRLSSELHYISEAANAQFTKLDLDYTFNDRKDRNKYFSRSDQYNFAKKGIPVIFYFNGVHDDYHQPTDTAEKLNYDLLAKRTKLIFATAWFLANSENRITIDKSH